MQEQKIPQHIAIMMDGNGRWAKKRNRPRSFGHVEGGKTFEEIVKAASDLNLEYLTIFAFSTENWNRPVEEVDNLMSLLIKFIKRNLKTALKNDIRIRMIGDISKLSKLVQKSIVEIEEATQKCSGLKLQVAINYGGRDDILRAFRKMYNDIEENILQIDDVTEDTISRYLDTAGIPEPDLFIRTGGDERISNFLLWQFAYTEFYFTNILWPDFTREELMKAIQKYGQRERRFGEIHDALFPQN